MGTQKQEQQNADWIRDNLNKNEVVKKPKPLIIDLFKIYPIDDDGDFEIELKYYNNKVSGIAVKFIDIEEAERLIEYFQKNINASKRKNHV